MCLMNNREKFSNLDMSMNRWSPKKKWQNIINKLTQFLFQHSAKNNHIHISRPTNKNLLTLLLLGFDHHVSPGSRSWSFKNLVAIDGKSQRTPQSHWGLNECTGDHRLARRAGRPGNAKEAEVHL